MRKLFSSSRVLIFSEDILDSYKLDLYKAAAETVHHVDVSIFQVIIHQIQQVKTLKLKHDLIKTAVASADETKAGSIVSTFALLSLSIHILEDGK